MASSTNDEVTAPDPERAKVAKRYVVVYNSFGNIVSFGEETENLYVAPDHLRGASFVSSSDHEVLERENGELKNQVMELAGDRIGRKLAALREWKEEAEGKLIECGKAIASATDELAALRGASRMTEERAREIAVKTVEKWVNKGGGGPTAVGSKIVLPILKDAILSACTEATAALVEREKALMAMAKFGLSCYNCRSISSLITDLLDGVDRSRFAAARAVIEEER